MSLRTISVYLCFLIIACVLVHPHMITLADDPSLGWHLRSGLDMIVKTQIFDVDPYLGVLPPRFWIADQWLGSIILASIYSIFDWNGLYLITTALFLFTFCVVWLSFLETYTGRICVSLYVTLVCLKVSLHSFVIRPALLSDLLFVFFLAWLFLVIKRIRNGRELEIFDWVFGGLTMLLWIQIHPTSLMVLFSLLIVSLGLVVEQIFFSKRIQSNSLIAFCFIFPVIVSCISLLNPSGISLHQQILTFAQSDFLHQFSSDWKPIQMLSGDGPLLLLAIVLSLLGVYHRIQQESDYYLPELLLAFTFIALSFVAVRFLPATFLILSPWLVWGIAVIVDLDWFTRFAVLRKVKLSIITIQTELRSKMIGIIGTGFLCLWIVLAQIKILPVLPEILGPSIDQYPYGAMRFLKGVLIPTRKQQGDGPIVVLNTIPWGGFITFSLTPFGKPLYDDRLLLRGEGDLRRYSEDFMSGADVKKFISEQKADILLLPESSHIHQKIVRADKPIYQDGQAVIYRLPLRDPSSTSVDDSAIDDTTLKYDTNT